jgi:hypothetical protein
MDYNKIKHLFNVTYYNEHGEHQDQYETGQLFNTYLEADQWAKNNLTVDYRIATIEQDYDWEAAENV